VVKKGGRNHSLSISVFILQDMKINTTQHGPHQNISNEINLGVLIDFGVGPKLWANAGWC